MSNSIRNCATYIRINTRSNLLFLIILLMFITISSCVHEPQEFGFLEGHVTIGPLVPVFREGEIAPTPAPEVYSSREIIIYKEDGKTEFCRLPIDSIGNYRGGLPVGVYIIDINRIGVDSAANLPLEIRITVGDIKTVDIDIDTGIR